MSARRITKDSDRSRAGAAAARWLLRLEESAPDARGRDEAFLDWLGASPLHVRLFLETFQTYRLLGNMDPQRAIDIQHLLDTLHDDVIRLHGAPPAPLASVHPKTRFRTPFKFAAAAMVVLAAGAVITWGGLDAETYSTAIGEQRTCKLDDGSFVHLNTDSRLRVQLSRKGRSVRLLRGEALFVVEGDSRRPFTVTTDDADIQVLGTQFNVRRQANLTDVAVVDGAVQVTAAGTSSAAGSTARLTGGEGVRATGGQLTRQSGLDIVNVLAWRQRRLVFTDTPLREVAAEFNRYNKTRIVIEGADARKRQFTGIFDADNPQAVILYAMKDPALAVEPQGSGWVIRGR